MWAHVEGVNLQFGRPLDEGTQIPQKLSVRSVGLGENLGAKRDLVGQGMVHCVGLSSGVVPICMALSLEAMLSNSIRRLHCQLVQSKERQASSLPFLPSP